MPRPPAIVAAFEIGTSQINILVGAVTDDSVTVVGRGTAPVRGGVVKGEIQNMEMVCKAMDQAVEQAVNSSNGLLHSCKEITLTVTGCNIECSIGTGNTTVKNEHGIVGQQEMEEALENARLIYLPAGHRLVQSVILYWLLDHRPLGDPLEQRGRRLENRSLLVHGQEARLDNFRLPLESCGFANVRIDEIYSPIASKEGAVSDAEANEGVLLVDMGSGCTDYLVAHDGSISVAGTFQIGFDHVANDLSLGLKLPFEYCRKLLENGTIAAARNSGVPALEIDTFPNGKRVIPLESFEQIINSRLRETFTLIREAAADKMMKINSPSGVLVGGGALYPSTLQIFREVMNCSCRIGKVANATGSISGLDSPRYTAVWGALLTAGVYYRSLYGSNRGSLTRNLIDSMNNIWFYWPRALARLWKAFRF